MNLKGKILVVAIALSGLAVGTVAIAQSSNEEKVDQENKKIDEKITIEIKDGNKKVTVTTTVNGKKTIQIFEGEEAEAFLKEHHTFGEQQISSHHSICKDSIHCTKIMKHCDFSELEGLSKEIMDEIHSAMKEIDITINGEDFSWFSDCDKKDDKDCDLKLLIDANMDEFHAEMKELHKIMDNLDIDVEVEEDGDKVIRKITIVSDKKEQESSKEKSDTEKEMVKIYPNPSSGKFKVEIKGKEGIPTKLSVVDINGKTVFFKELNGKGTLIEDINLKKQSSGNYIVSIEQGGKVLKQKILIEK